VRVIKALGRRSFDDVCEIGQRFDRCRELLKTQRVWLAWIKLEFGVSRRTVERFIALSRAKDKVGKLRTFGVGLSGLYLLSKASPEVVEETERHVEAGGRLKVADVKRRMRAAPDPVQEFATRFNAAFTSITSSQDTNPFDRIIGGGPPASTPVPLLPAEAPSGASAEQLPRPQMNITDAASSQKPTKQLTSADLHRAVAERFPEWLADVARGLASFEPAAETAAALPMKHSKVDEDVERIMHFLDEFRRARREAGAEKLKRPVTHARHQQDD
jgi:hypothetical protein